MKVIYKIPQGMDKIPRTLLPVDIVFKHVRSMGLPYVDANGVYHAPLGTAVNEFRMKASRERFIASCEEIERGSTFAITFAFRDSAILNSGRHRLAALMAKNISKVMIIPEYKGPDQYDDLNLIEADIMKESHK